MKPIPTYQIVISGIGGQGVLFVTRLLAEAAIAKGLPVFTSETHGMAQRGGTVISHLKIGAFDSPLITPGRADGLIALKAENIARHGGYLKPGGWTTVNRADSPPEHTARRIWGLDADGLAGQLGAPQSVNLIMLGFTLTAVAATDSDSDALFCTPMEIAAILERRLNGRTSQLNASRRALEAGAAGTMAR
jgi:indolepyruvate ferredoxin oxidoreductase beta subunit